VEGVWNALGAVLEIQLEDQTNPLYRQRVGKLRWQIISQTIRSLDQGCKMIKEIALWALRSLASDVEYKFNGHPSLSTRGQHLSVEMLFGVSLKGIKLKTFLGSLATIDRSLPCGTNELAVKKMEDFLLDISTPCELPDNIVEAVYKVARRIGRRLGNVPDHSHFSLSTSSCVEMIREHGGKAGYIYLALDIFAQLPIKVEWQNVKDWRGVTVFTVTLQPGDLLWQVAYREVRQVGVFRAKLTTPDGINHWDGVDKPIGDQIQLWAFSELINKRYISPSKAPLDSYLAIWDEVSELVFTTGEAYPTKIDFVSEPGYRVRIINVPPASASVIQQIARHAIEPVLWRDKRAQPGEQLYYIVQSFLVENKKPALTIPNEEIWVKSTDFKGASNKLPFNYNRALLHGFLEGINLPKAHPLWKIESLLYARRAIYAEKVISRWQNEPYSIEDRIRSANYDHRRGTLLGDPFSFVILSLSTLFVYEVAEIYTDSKEEVKFPLGLDQLMESPTVRHYHGQILGDDAIVFTRRPFLVHYNHVVSQVHLEISLDKDLESQLVGTYTEQYTFRETVSEDFRYHDTIKSRYFSPFSKSVGLTADGRSPALSKAGPLSRVLYYYNDPINRDIYYQKGRCASYYYHCYPSMLKLETAGFPVGLPLACGGCSAPIDDEKEYLNKHSILIEHLYYIVKAPLPEFLGWFFKLGYLTHGSRHGLIRPLSKTQEYQVALDPVITSGSGIYTSNDVRIELTQLGQPPRMRGPFLDYRDLATKAATHLKIYGLSTLISKLERNAEFEAALAEPLVEPRPVKITERNYVQNFRALIPELSALPITAELPPWETLDALNKAFIYRFADIYISGNHPLIQAIIENGTSLEVSLSRP